MLNPMNWRRWPSRLGGTLSHGPFAAACILASVLTAFGARAQIQAAEPGSAVGEIPETAAPLPTGATGAPVAQGGPLTALPPDSPPPGSGAELEPTNYDVSADTDPAAVSDFQQTLAPYGTWEEDPAYGVVWMPSSTVVGADFAPYVSHGHWGYADNGNWQWVSDFSWGWAPFHYGRWVWIGGRGWAWIAGRVYSPAWVVWRTGYYDDYYVGWAPMPPTWYWRGGAALYLGRVPPASYVFCSSRYVFAPGVRSYVVPASRVGAIAPRTQPYVPAAPNAGYRAAAFTRAPSISDAHIPASAIPAERVRPDPRAAAFARDLPQARAMGSGRSPEFTPHVSPGVDARPRPFDAARPLPSPNEVARPQPRFFEPRSPSPAPNGPRTLSPAPAPVPYTPRAFAPPPAPAPVYPRFAPQPGPSPQPAPAAPRFMPAPRPVAPTAPPAYSPRPMPAPAAPRVSPGPAFAPRAGSPSSRPMPVFRGHVGR